MRLTFYVGLYLSCTLFVLIKSFVIRKGSLVIQSRSLILRTQPIIKSEYACLKEWNVLLPYAVKDSSCSVFDYLCGQTDNYFTSSTQIKKSIRKGLILLNNNKTSTTTNISDGDIIKYIVRSGVETTFSTMKVNATMSLNDTEKTNTDRLSMLKPDLTQCSVIWEDEYVAVVLKPQGTPMFNTRINAGQDVGIYDDKLTRINNSIEQSLHSLLLTQLSPAAQGPLAQPLRRPRLAHRLDQGTGGLVIIAKTHPALSILTAAFAERRVHKHYRALVAGKLINTPQYQLNRNASGKDSESVMPSFPVLNNSTAIEYVGITLGTNKTIQDNLCLQKYYGSILVQLDGKDAVTDWVAINHTLTKHSGWITTVDAFPHTGRNHQIRRHLDSVGHPILGDPDYWFTRGRRTSSKYFQKQTMMYPLLQVCL